MGGGASPAGCNCAAAAPTARAPHRPATRDVVNGAVNRAADAHNNSRRSESRSRPTLRPEHDVTGSLQSERVSNGRGALLRLFVLRIGEHEIDGGKIEYSGAVFACRWCFRFLVHVSAFRCIPPRPLFRPRPQRSGSAGLRARLVGRDESKGDVRPRAGRTWRRQAGNRVLSE